MITSITYKSDDGRRYAWVTREDSRRWFVTFEPPLGRQRIKDRYGRLVDAQAAARKHCAEGGEE